VVGFIAMLCELLLFEILRGRSHSTQIMAVSWGGVAVVYCVARGMAWWHLRRLGKKIYRSTEDVFEEIARLETGGLTHFAVKRASYYEVSSFAWLLVVFSLLAPLTLHLLFSLAFLSVGPSSFNGWIRISLLVVGHSHLVLLVLSILHIIQTKRELDRGIRCRGSSRGFKALLWTTLASALPGIVLFCIPPALVFLTGIIFVPWIFSWAHNRMVEERRILESFMQRIKVEYSSTADLQ
jgi:hypothetical protein